MKITRPISTMLVTLLCVTIIRGGAEAQQTAKTSGNGSSAETVSHIDSSTLLARIWPSRKGFSLMPANRYASGARSASAILPAAMAPLPPAVHGTGTVGRISMWVDTSSSGNSVLGDSIITQLNGNIGIGLDTPLSKLTVQGMIETTLGGYKFPDGTIQTTAAVSGLQSVIHDSTLTGNGTAGSPLGIAVPLFLTTAWPGPIFSLINTQLGGSGIYGVSDQRGDGVHGQGGRGGNAKGGIGVYGAGGFTTSGDAGDGVSGVGGLSGSGVPGTGVRALGGRGVTGGDGVNAIGGDAFDDGIGGTGVRTHGGESVQTGGSGVAATGGGGFLNVGGTGVEATGGNSLSGEGGIGMFARGGNSLSGFGGTGLFATGGNGFPNGLAAVFGGGVHVDGNLEVIGPAGGGNLTVTGNLDVQGTKNFKIDHPLDPENKYLLHAAIESSEVLNVYSGNIVTNAKGEAVVTLPEWFDDLNSDLRYQLTVIGTFAQAIVAEKVKQNRFTIKTNAPNVEVSWQVTGVRSDAMMRKHPFKAEASKPERERGSYLAPELFGKSEERGVEWALYPEMMRQLQQQRLEAAKNQKQQKQISLFIP